MSFYHPTTGAKKLAGDDVILRVTFDDIRTVDCTSNTLVHSIFIKNVSYTAVSKAENGSGMLYFLLIY